MHAGDLPHRGRRLPLRRGGICDHRPQHACEQSRGARRAPARRRRKTPAQASRPARAVESINVTAGIITVPAVHIAAEVPAAKGAPGVGHIVGTEDDLSDRELDQFFGRLVGTEVVDVVGFPEYAR